MAKIMTLPATSITRSGAVLNSSLQDLEEKSTVWFEWGPTISLGKKTPVTDANDKKKVSNGQFTAKLSGLSGGTAYFYRVVLKSGQIEKKGSIYSFATVASNGQDMSASLPIASTNGASDLYGGNAKLNGYIDPRGAETSYWFEWGTDSQNLSEVTEIAKLGTKSGFAVTELKDLKPGTTYYFRLAAANASGVIYGQIFSFIAF